MSFYTDGKDIVIDACSEKCVLKKYEKQKKDFSIEFSGASKSCNIGIRIDGSFIVQKEAESWDGRIHDFGITINRESIVKENTVLKKIRYLNNDNLLKIKDVCECCVELEYIDGYILNTKKGNWLLGEHSYELDYLDICSWNQFINLARKVLKVLIELHKNGICHTDVMDHNIMIRKKDDVPILIDLIGAMPYSKELEELDKRVFLNHVVVDGCKRLGIPMTSNILGLKKYNGKYDLNILDAYLKELNDSLNCEDA